MNNVKQKFKKIMLQKFYRVKNENLIIKILFTILIAPLFSTIKRHCPVYLDNEKTHIDVRRGFDTRKLF